MPQVSLSASTNFDGEQNALVEDQGTSLTIRFDLDEAAPEGGLKVFVDSDVEQIANRLDLPAFAGDPTVENIDPTSVGTDFNNSGFFLTIDEGATTASFTIDVFDNPEPDTFLPETFNGLVEAAFSLKTQAEVSEEDAGDVGTLGDYTVDPSGASSTVVFVDEASQLTDAPEPPTPEPPASDALQVSLFTGPDYLIEDEGTVSAHAFNVTNGVIPEGGLLVSVDAPNLSEFDLAGVSVEGGEIAAVREGGFDLLMTEYTALVNLAVADDGETEVGETATFSLATGEGYEIIEAYSGGSFELVDTRDDIPQDVITEPNNVLGLATETGITSENPTFSGSDSSYFDIGNRYLNDDGTYTYIDYSEDVDLYKVALSAGETIAIETFDREGNPNGWDRGIELQSQIFDAEGNAVQDYSVSGFRLDPAAPDKLFGGIDFLDENNTDTYQEFTAPEDGDYYVGFGLFYNVGKFWAESNDFPPYDPLTPGSGSGNRAMFGNYGIEINLLTEDNPRQTGTPTEPVSNPGITNPPTLTLTANPFTIDSEGNLTNAAVEYVEPDGLSGVNFTIEAEGEIPEGGIEFVLNSNTNLFDYVSLISQNDLPSTFGGQSLGAFYNEEGIPTGIRLRIEEPTMTVSIESADNRPWFPGLYGNIIDAFEPLETDGTEDVIFSLQPGEGYEVSAEAETAEILYYDSIADVPPPTGGSSTIPEVGVTISETALVETEETETTITFTLSEAPPTEGVTVYLDSDQNPVVGSALSQFAVLEAEVTGGKFPVPNGDSSGFYFTVTEQTATITLSAFDELSLGLNIPPENLKEGIVGLNFSLQPQAGYTIDSNASEFDVTIADNPDSQIQISLAGSIQTGEEENEDSTTLIESEGTVSLHTFSLSAPPPEEGLTVSVSADTLGDFNLDAIEVTGGTIAAVREDGLDLTITEQEATIALPVLADDVSEGSETATFTLEPGDVYEINAAATEATFTLVETIDQASVAEEIEGNDTLSEANPIGLSLDNSVVSISGRTFNDESIDYPEEVDFYSFDLEAGQTVSLDIDTEKVLPEVLEFRPIVYPALEKTLQKPDTELRLFDAEGNELATNTDGAAPDEEFSRDPFLNFTAETSGTYYVGVSQLGNRNYDPNVEKSGSGWTFPEVGVYFGPYELTATLTDGDTPSPTEETTFTFDWTGQIAGFSIQGDFSYDPNQTYTDGIVREENLTDFDLSFFAPDGTLLRTYEDNYLTFDDFNFAFDTNTQEILQDGDFLGPEGINIGEKTAVGDGFSGLNFWSRPEFNSQGEVPPPHVHFDDWADEFSFPIGFSGHEDVAFFTRTTQELLDTGRVGDAYASQLTNLDEVGDRIQITEIQGPTPEIDGYQPGDAFSLVTPPPTYEGDLNPGEQANADFVDQLEGDALLDELQDGGYVIYFRHAMTERDFADQVTADVTDFSTQRVLSEFGIKQSLAIGEGFDLGEIPFDEVITSEYGRAVKTAVIAFGEYQKDSALNFLPFEDYTDAQIEEMRANITPFLTAEPDAGTNTVIVGHDDLFEAGTGIYPDPQGIAYVLDPDGSGGFDLVANILPEEWVQLTGEGAEDGSGNGDTPMPVESDGATGGDSGEGAGPIPTEDAEASNGYQPGEAFNLVTPPPTYESELSSGEQANAEFVDLLEGEALLDELQDGGHVIYFRHAMTERDFADQVTADVTDFSTQRVVSEFGVKQSLAIGEGFDLGEIPFDEVITSEYGRAIETAAIAFGEYQKDSALNFLPFEDYTDAQVDEMRSNVLPLLTTAPDAGTNTIIVGHDDLFEAGTGIYPDPQGTAYVLTPDGNGSFEIVANLLPEEWVELSEFIPDELLGTNGRDRLFGAEGNDTISALAGNDSIFGGAGNDTISGGSENDRLFGGEGNDTINGDSEKDKLFGGAGDDSINGGSERDRLFGEVGNDILTGGSERDALFGGDGQDILSGGSGRDRLFGGEARDILIGDMGNDFLSGGAGDDVLMGVTGKDTLEGGDGADLFVFGVGDGTDVVKDFEVGTDKIGLVDSELTFADLTITAAGNRTLLGVTSSGETLAVLRGINAESLTESGFEIVPNVATVEEAMAIL